MNFDRLKYRYWQHTDWHDTNSPLETVYCNAVDGCDPTIAVSDFEFCTGLKDKNGNMIYEGDLIKSPNNSHPLAVYHDTTGLWRCKENRPNGIWELPLYDIVRNYTAEIIGNIHEQAEQKEYDK